MRCSLAVLVACLPLCGCLGLGPIRLRADQIGFSRALLDSEKQATLLNAVRLRYAATASTALCSAASPRVIEPPDTTGSSFSVRS
jgi:hypothetical protein